MFYQAGPHGVGPLVKRARWGIRFAAIAAVVAWRVSGPRGVEYQLGRFSLEGRPGLETDPSGWKLRCQDFSLRLLEREPSWVREPHAIEIDGVEGKKTSTSVFAPVVGGTPGQHVRDHQESYWFPWLGTGLMLWYRTFGGLPDSWRDFTSRRWARRVFSTLRIRR